ncbi:hypothetical protein [Corynebacterium provencense]|uniref:hypothetical protein n=1 Tax=Corynebacterium provencense TaxID=1737425 RepID=UPI00083707F8|nr:hypothetical protein [Corynebacterium provencense]
MRPKTYMTITEIRDALTDIIDGMTPDDRRRECSLICGGRPIRDIVLVEESIWSGDSTGGSTHVEGR